MGKIFISFCKLLLSEHFECWSHRWTSLWPHRLAPELHIKCQKARNFLHLYSQRTEIQHSRRLVLRPLTTDQARRPGFKPEMTSKQSRSANLSLFLKLIFVGCCVVCAAQNRNPSPHCENLHFFFANEWFKPEGSICADRGRLPHGWISQQQH